MATLQKLNEMTADVKVSRAETSFERAKVFNFELNKILID